MSYQNILVPVDGSKISFSAVKHAVEIAKVFDSRLTLISLVSEDPFTDADFYYYYVSAPMKEHFLQAYANAEEILKQASEIAYAAGVQVETKVLKSVLLEEGIVETAKQLETDLIVMGSHGRKGFKKWRLGSVATAVLCSTELPVMVIKY
ncbi:universal stress protein [Acinetobacter sp. ANC 4862]|jgi:nucleotide-binding universal stress UspA family protein|uniref:universal stress protein n=1 Tax=Acinetobacter sp. ANC 4862 TaxID=2529849 RepID=UPI00103B625E|nr:universal stress protein [Acinetobacter sp. ANC 4862]TCH63727.1 universal stress protein [Acinetobacter sp. ANC 4862]